MIGSKEYLMELNNDILADKIIYETPNEVVVIEKCDIS
jgi:lipopolysaccharide export system protein LptA